MLPQVLILALTAGVAVTLVIVAIMAVVGAPRARMKKRIAAVVGTGPMIVADAKGGRDQQIGRPQEAGRGKAEGGGGRQSASTRRSFAPGPGACRIV